MNQLRIKQRLYLSSHPGLDPGSARFDTLIEHNSFNKNYALQIVKQAFVELDSVFKMAIN